MGFPRRTTNEAAESARSGEGMHVCPGCNSKLIQPVQWFERGDGHWHVDRRCPECEWFGRGSFAQREVNRFDEELDRGSQELLEDLRSLTRANMEDEADRFALALANDSILPGLLVRTAPPSHSSVRTGRCHRAPPFRVRGERRRLWRTSSLQVASPYE